MYRTRISLFIVAGALLTAACDSSPVEPALTRGPSFATTGSTSFSESFDYGALSPNGKLEAVGAGTLTWANGAVIFSDPWGERAYLRTTAANYHKMNLTVEATVTVPSTGAEGIAFIGLGAGETAGCWFWCEPAQWPSIYARLTPDYFNPGTQVTTVRGEYDIFEGLRTSGTASGTHRVRMTWNPTTSSFSIAIDTNYVEGSAFVADASVGPVVVPAGMFTENNGRVFIGGAAGVTFYNLKIVAKPVS